MSASLSLAESVWKSVSRRRVSPLALALPALAGIFALPAFAGAFPAIFLGPPPAGAPTAVSVATDARNRVQASDYQVTGHLVQTSGTSKKTSSFSLKAMWFPDGLHMLSEITSPAESRSRMLLTISPTGHETIQTAKPGDKAAKTLPVERWGDPLLNTNFSLEDLADAQFFWEKQTLLPDAKYGTRDCLVLKSEPGPADHTHYASVTSWIDKKINAVVHVEKSPRTGAHKEFIYYGLRQVSGVWSAAQIEAKVEGSSDTSLLILERGSAQAKLARKDFDPALLIKP